MKKVIAIAVVVVVALVGLTSYNGSGEKKSGNDRLLAELKTGNTGGVISGGGNGGANSGGNSGKKLD